MSGRPPEREADTASQIAAARGAAILAGRPDRGLLLFSGKDAADLLHRLTTNALRDLRPGEGRAAVFATPKGRILDLVLFHLLPEGFWAVTGPGRGREVAAWVERYTFREEVRVEDRGATHGVLGLFGAGASGVIGRLFGPAAAALPPHHVVRVDRPGEAPVLVAATFPLAGGGFHLIAEHAALPALGRGILAAGEVLQAGPAAVEFLRIEAGLPETGAELTEQYNPWEARLHDAVALNKGCYVGQEVIARLDTYKKISKVLVRIRAGGPPPVPGAAIRFADQIIGTITSAAPLPEGTGSVTLGYVRDEDAVAGRQVLLGEPSEPGVIEGPAR